MRFWNTFGGLIGRELRAVQAHRWLLAGLLGAAMGGVILALQVTGDARLWTAFQVLYYFLPLASILSAIMIVRQDLAEGPFLAMLPSSSACRVAAKAVVSAFYGVLGLSLFLLPGMRAGTNERAMAMIWVGGALVVSVFSSLGVMIGLRARHEVRAYLAGIGTWVGLLLGSGLVAYISTVSLHPEYTPALTLAALLVNPLESFRIFAFFGISAVPMNPHTLNPIAVWWLAHPLAWLACIASVYLGASLVFAGRGLRHRAHPVGA